MCLLLTQTTMSYLISSLMLQTSFRQEAIKRPEELYDDEKMLCIVAILNEFLSMLIGANIDGKEAKEIGLADYLAYDNDSLEEILDDIKNQVFKCSPNAIAITKKVITVDQYLDPEKAADLFSDCVVSDEGKEGFKSFFEKRKPSWVPNEIRKK